MLRLLIFIIIAFSAGCNKVAEKANLSIITDGQWKITQFIRNNEDLTAAFDSYKFQFKNNKTIDAIKGSEVEKTGTWEPDFVNQSLQSYFQNAYFPLILLNGKWTVIAANSTLVEATLNIDGEKRIVKITKV